MEKTKAKKILFTSGKGGVGKSTLSTTFAKVLSSEGKKVLMIDFDISLRTLDIMLSVSNLVLYDWYDVIAEDCDPEAALLKTRGPYLLAAPVGDISVSEDEIKKLISYYENDFDFIILDCPAGVGDVLTLTLSVADSAFIISTPDYVCVRSAAVAAEKAHKASVPSRLIINRFKKNTVTNGRALNIDDVIDATGVQLIGIVPDDMDLSLSILNGELIDPALPSVKAVKRIIKRMNGENIPLSI